MLKRCIMTAAIATFATGVATAAPVEVTDPNSDFKIIYDDSTTGPFGTPFLSNNTIFFLPDNFVAMSANGDGEMVTNDTVQLHLIATTPGFTFDSFDLREEGDYRLLGGGSSVSVGGEMIVRDWNFPFVSASDAILPDAPLTMTSDADPNVFPRWNASAMIDASTGWAAGVDEVALTIENILTASSFQFGSSAFIEKKFAGVEITVNPVPVPAAFWLFAPALLALWRRRRNS